MSTHKTPSIFKCPRCSSSGPHLTLGIDAWDDDDVTTYMACTACDLVFWFSSFLNKVSTNWRDL